MTRTFAHLTRRGFLGGLAASGAAAALGWTPLASAQQGEQPLMKPIPATGERVPAIGMGTWITFNVGELASLRAQRAEIVAELFARGGRIIDSSPMYGTAETVVGYCLDQLDEPDDLFAATKVWTRMADRGAAQMAESRRLWGVETFDLMQIHNLVDWQTHLPRLLDDKAQGRLRYIGITTSHGRRHEELMSIMRNEPIDFVQLTYNILDREPEKDILPLARERGIAVIANRPFRQKQLIARFENAPLPEWASEIDCANWPQFLLKFIVSHPDVTCTIPATTRVDHMREDTEAMYGRQPDQAMREQMVRHVERL
ncbi:secreted protein [Modicisalibacter xianhensis]|uniref:Secreted protein n=1 Tax=Modicisalibacter xianhensis TaxID=442341 RepID=A0A4R8FWA2_9GAMM|nr:aldo/keto reductase [Halomonas xianhensis]TDX30857.1 secreted protein [Halomonas xianhensis]